jgi:hypothetical protein
MKRNAYNGNAWISSVTSHFATIGEIERVTGIDFLSRATGLRQKKSEFWSAGAVAKGIDMIL